MRDARAGTSFLQSLAEIDHRDRFHNHHAPNHHKHAYLHQRQVDTTLEIDSTVASVTATVSVIQDIEIDSNGNTLQIQTWLAASTTVEAPPDPTVPGPTVVDITPLTTPAIATTTDAPTPTPTTPPSTTALGSLNTEMISQSTNIQPILSAATSQALSLSLSLPSSSSSSSSIPSSLPLSSSLPSSLPLPLPLTSAPFLGTNSSISTVPSSSSGSSFPSLSSSLYNHTTPTLLISSSSEIGISSSSLSSSVSTSLSSDYSSTGSYDSSITPAPTVAGGDGAGGGLGVSSSSSSTSTAAAGTIGGSGNASTAPSTPAVVGGVFGGIAGIVFIVAVLMVLVRWRKHKQSLWRLGDGPSTEPPTISGDTSSPLQPGGMTERSLPFVIPAALANLTGYKRASQPSIEASSTAGSERGFYRVSGRKLPSVLQHGGDGYGGGNDAAHESLSGSSFYRDSRGFYGGPGSPVSPLAGRESGIPISRPSPARTPVISEGAFGPPSPIPVPPLGPPRRPDALGRSHPSRDGSHGSRFTEEV